MINKTLNKDWYLKQSDINHYDLDLDFNDAHIVNDLDSLRNGVKFAILTGYNELWSLLTYQEWGNQARDLLKANQTAMTKYKIELYIRDCLEKIRRIASVDTVEVTETPFHYSVNVKVTSITDEVITETTDLLIQPINTSFTVLSSDSNSITLLLHDYFKNKLYDKNINITCNYDKSTTHNVITNNKGALTYNFKEDDDYVLFSFKGVDYYAPCNYEWRKEDINLNGE